MASLGPLSLYLHTGEDARRNRPETAGSYLLTTMNRSRPAHFLCLAHSVHAWREVKLTLRNIN